MEPGRMKEKTIFWDLVANIYDIFVYLINRKTHKKLRKEIGSLIQLSDVVLECACGTGMLTEVIAPKCKKLVATDFSKNMVRKARAKCRRLTNIEFMAADITNLDFADHTFDKVVAGNVIHLLDDPYKALKEMERVCRSGGKILVPTYINENAKYKENAFSKILGKIGVDFKLGFSVLSYRRFFTEAGFTRVKFILVEGRIPCMVAVIRKVLHFS